MKYLLTMLLIGFWLTSMAQVDSTDIWISRIHNSQLKGMCHYVWTIEVDKHASEVFRLIKAGSPVRNKLIDRLTEPDKGVICHYILATISDTLSIEAFPSAGKGVKYRVNGLEFEEVQGLIHAKSNDLKSTQAYWRKRYRQSGH